MEGPVGWRGRSGGEAGRVECVCGPAYVWSGMCVVRYVCGPVYVWSGMCVDWHLTRRSAAAVGNLT